MMKKQGEQRLVPKLRFKGFSEDWEQRKFSEIFKRVSKSSNSESLPIVEYEDIDNEARTLKSDFQYRYSNKEGLEFLENDILYGKLRPYLKNQILSDFKGKAIGDFWILRSYLNNPTFNYYLLNTPRLSHITNLTTGTRMPRSDWKTINSYTIKVPDDIKEAELIADFLSYLDKTISLHKRKSLIYKRLRDYYSSLFYSTERGIIFSNSKDSWKKEKLNKVFYPHKLSDVIFSKEDKDLNGDTLYIITQGDTPIKEIIKGTGNQDYEEVIFFGDHTLSLSKINGPYKVDTDGVKVLHVDKDFDRDFIFNLIKCNMPASEGYKRHFTILKNKKVWLTTDINEQVKISDTLNLLDKLVSSQNNKIEQLQNLRVEYLNTLFI